MKSRPAFLGCAGPEGLAAARLALLGVPLDVTASYRPGAGGGPAAVRAASDALEEYSLHLDRDLADVAVCDLGDVMLPAGAAEAPEAALGRAEAAAGAVLAAGPILLALGGEHLITLPLFRAARHRFPDLALIWLDAHADLREAYEGRLLSHATVLRRIWEAAGGRRAGPAVFPLGVRSATAEEVGFAREELGVRLERRPAGPAGYRVGFPGAGGDLAAALDAAMPALAGRPVYLSLDIDVLDPAFAPGTGAPEPGGVEPRAVFEFLYALGYHHRRGHLRVVAMDLVEVCPACDPSGRTAVLAAKLVREALLSLG